jgi:hypothetical protein
MSAVPFVPPRAIAWLQALRQPELALAWSLTDWERVVRLSRRLRLLARLAEALDDAGLLDRVPGSARRHLLAEQRLSRMRTAAMCWTIERLSPVLAEGSYPRVLLKGAAYLGQELGIARGRLPSDLDLLVPKAHIADAQSRLVRAGWTERPLDDHDRRYYHEWTHEVPPMTHPLLQLEVDLHHNILPPLSHAPVDAQRLLSRLIPSRFVGWHVLDPADQVLHSAAHLFFDSELRDRLRDLVDLDGLLRHFGQEPAFWRRLAARSTELGLGEPLALACHFTSIWLGTRIPSETAGVIAEAGPGALQRAWLLPVLSQALHPVSPDERPTRVQGGAALLVLARYHYRRLPLRLLLPHLWHKWRIGRRQLPNDLAETPEAH